VNLTRRAFLAGGAVTAVLGAVPLSNTYRFQVNRHARPLPGLRAPLRVAHLSDLHYGPYVHAGSVRAWVDAALRERPDLAVITGDIMDSAPGDGAEHLLRELARLRAPLGVWGVWGNHDYGSFGRYAQRLRTARRSDWQDGRAAFETALRDAGVRILTNTGVRLRPDVFLAGVDDAWWGAPDIPAALAAAGGGATLLMAHNPDLLPQVPRRVGITLCGHTHGGQVRFPFIGAPMIPSEYGERFAMGFVHAPALGFVSRGLGVSGVPARLGCPAELVIHDFLPV